MTVPKLILLYIIALGGLSIPLALLMGSDSYIYKILVRDFDFNYVIKIYLVFITSITTLYLQYILFLRRIELRFYRKPPIFQSDHLYKIYWNISMLFVLIFTIILFIQNNFKHPISNISESIFNPIDFAIQRKLLSEKLNGTIYNLGLHFFLAPAFILAFFYLKCNSIKYITVIVLVIFIPFKLAKSPILDFAIQILIFYLILQPNKKINFIYLASGVIILVFLFFITTNVTQISDLIDVVLARIFVGEFSDLPAYFLAFENESANLISIFPPYILSIFNINAANLDPGKIVIEYTLGNNTSALLSAGVANSFFIGSAYAYFGSLGVVASPILVFLNFYLVVKLFYNLPKKFIYLFLLSYFLFRLTHSISSGISYFLSSGVQFLLLVIYILHFYFLVKNRQQTTHSHLSAH